MFHQLLLTLSIKIKWSYMKKKQLHTQVEHYGLRIHSFTAVYDAGYGRIHAIYTPYTTVFLRITWGRITTVYLRDRIRQYTMKNGSRTLKKSVIRNFKKGFVICNEFETLFRFRTNKVSYQTIFYSSKKRVL